MKNFFIFIWEVIKIVIIALAIVIPIRYFLFQPFIVRGQSMEPTFENGDYLIVDEISYRFSEPKRGEVVVFRHPENPNQRLIKRIIGLPRETIKFEDGKIIILNENGEIVLDESGYLPSYIQTEPRSFESITLSKDEYLALGDNRPNSSDSRIFGPISKEKIIGKVLVRVWPFTALAKFDLPEYQPEEIY